MFDKWKGYEICIFIIIIGILILLLFIIVGYLYKDSASLIISITIALFTIILSSNWSKEASGALEQLKYGMTELKSKSEAIEQCQQETLRTLQESKNFDDSHLLKQSLYNQNDKTKIKGKENGPK